LIIRKYFRWKALGKGGVAHNVFGYLEVLAITPVARRRSQITDTSDLEEIVKNITEEEGENAVFRRLNLEHRRGDRPEVRGIIPQRQMNQSAPVSLRNVSIF